MVDPVGRTRRNVDPEAGALSTCQDGGEHAASTGVALPTCLPDEPCMSIDQPPVPLPTPAECGVVIGDDDRRISHPPFISGLLLGVIDR